MIPDYLHLTGKQWIGGSDDCYGIIQHYYDDSFGIKLTNYARPDYWWNKGLDLYRDNFRAEGFSVVDIELHEMWIGDLILVCVGSEVPCHAGVYVDQGKILHHYRHRLSEVVPPRGIWRTARSCIIRHKDVPELREEGKPLDLMSLMPKRFRDAAATASS
ncbi:NlpC/P60 family protein [Inquilinus limosus]|uniref:NlpC/P60 family protein n=1 Tax=Inquilinus limosus TaxID=171674 RepID=UPI0009DEE425|nr:NlpC/P60 family protein [Inquilinus limosus]